MATIKLKGVHEVKGNFYRRFVSRDPITKKQVARYIPLPHLTDPNFAAKLAEINAAAASPTSIAPVPRSLAALIHEFRPVLKTMRNKRGELLAADTHRAWDYYLGLFEAEHGQKLVADIERGHCYTMRDNLGETPGKANAYMAKFKGLLEFASARGWLKDNPARGIPLLNGGEYVPWPVEVIQQVLATANPTLRLAIISALCSGQRISDLIRMQHSWIKGQFMLVPGSKKTDTPASIPMHAIWVEEIAKVKALASESSVSALTLLYDRTGKPFKDTDRPQAQLRRVMKDLGHVKGGEGDDADEPLYSFHGLSKNAICYLLELGLTEEAVGAIVGKTVETVRHYGKETKLWMLAQASADTVMAGSISRLMEVAKS